MEKTHLNLRYFYDMAILDDRLTLLEEKLDDILDRLSRLEVETLERTRIKREKIDKTGYSDK